MSWFNYIGLIIMVIIMLPNIIYAIRSNDGRNNSYRNKAAEIFEQIGRYGCFVTMIFNIPYTCFGFWFNGALPAYIVVNAVLCFFYLICWAAIRGTNSAKALTLSLLPSTVFLFSGVMLLNIPLIAFAVIFAPCHILISCKNVTEKD